ncbi:helix-turn-helix transcriptional regulator, partial [Campylobacter jejuni]|nr:helix-turn-helix transcriptional regulator [Campylobacter jejuni]
MKNIIGKKLKDLRNAYGISQREFGEKVGITKGS